MHGISKMLTERPTGHFLRCMGFVLTSWFMAWYAAESLTAPTVYSYQSRGFVLKAVQLLFTFNTFCLFSGWKVQYNSYNHKHRLGSCLNGCCEYSNLKCHTSSLACSLLAFRTELALCSHKTLIDEMLSIYT